MTIYGNLPEGAHAAEFVASHYDPNYNVETGTLSSGQKVVDGQLLQASGSEMIAKAATLTTDGDFAVPVLGIVIGNWDASATGTNADILDVPYIARGPLVVKADALTYPSGSEDEAAAALVAMDIIPR
jgi:hypothetical protein